MKKLFVLLLLSAFIHSCNTRQKKESNLTQLIPQTSSVIVKINDIETFKSDIKNNDFITSIYNTKPYKLLDKKIKLINQINTNNSVLVCFENENDTLQFTLITKLKDSLFKKDIDSLKFHTKIIDSIFIGSTSKSIISNTKINYTEEYTNLFKTTNSEKSFSLLLPKKTTNTLANHLLNSNTENIGNWITLDSEISQDKIVLNGITTYQDTIPQLLNVFNLNIPQENNIQHLIPEQSESAISITFSDYGVFKENLSNYNKTENDSINNSEIFQTVNEIGLFFLNNQPLIAMHSLDANATNEALNILRNENSIYRDIPIYEYSNSNLFVRSFHPFFKIDSISHYSKIDDFYVFAKNTNIIEEVISNYQNGSVMSKSSQFESCFSNLSDESSILILSDSQKLNSTLTHLFEIDDLPSLNNYKLSAFQFIKDDNFTHFNGVINKTKSRVEQNSIIEEFSVKLDADVLMPPQFVKNHRTKHQDIVVQDINNNLYLISNSGKVLWKKGLHGKILGKIEQVDLYKNGRLQLAFATPKRVYILDRNGKDVGPFPMKLNDNITQPLSVFDYDKNRNYRFLITQGKEVLMVDKKAKSVRGFKFKKHSKSITSQPKHFRVNNKDFIAFTAGNKLILLNRKGEHRTKVKEDLLFSDNPLFLNNNKFTTTSSKGELIQVNLNGSVSKQALALEENHKIDATSKTLATLSDNKLIIRQKSYELDFGNYTAPKIFYINDKIYVTVTDLQTKKVFLFDSQARLQNNFPVYGNSTIDMINIDKDRNLEFVTKGDSNTIIVYQKN